jgi:acetyl esterase/lipase
MAAVGLLVLGLICAGLSTVATFGPRRPDRLAYGWFLLGLVTGELAPLHLMWQALVAATLVALGALDAPIGVAGGALLLLAWTGLVVAELRQARTPSITATALGERRRGARTERRRGARTERRGERTRPLALLRPLRPPAAGLERVSDLAYGDDEHQRLDVLRRPTGAPAPVVVHVHAGSWTGGRRDRQARTLRSCFAGAGWITVNMGYRVSPAATFPDHVVDVKRVLAWVREHAGELGADPSSVLLSGVSAGAHLAALAALTPNVAEWQPGFEDRDTSVLGCVSISGIYDLLDRHDDHPGSKRIPFLSHVVLKSDPEAQRSAWDAGSPIERVHAGAPPFFVIHARDDALVWREEAQRFVGALRTVSRSEVAYAELPGAQHAFETFYSVRSVAVAAAAVTFAERVRQASANQWAVAGRALG